MRLILTAKALSAHLGGELHVLSVWNAPAETILRGRCHFAINAEDIRQYVEGSRVDCATSLKELLGRSGVVLDRKRVHLLKGDPRLVIPRFCHDHGVAILVMGTVARTGFVGALLGNTAEEVAKSLPTSVVSVGPLAGSATGAEDLELAAAQESNR
jgi:nucleotide-binding universal stress UspA family protein